MASTKFMSTQYMPLHLFRRMDTQNLAGYNIIHVAGHKKDGEQRVPSWTGFNSILHRGNVPAYCSVGYCPVIKVLLTELDIAYTLLEHSVTVGNKLGQDDIIIVLDQAIHAKAQEIELKKHREF